MILESFIVLIIDEAEFLQALIKIHKIGKPEKKRKEKKEK